MEKEGKAEGERSVGWPYFLSGELYGAGLCVMTAEWIIISLSSSLSLFLSVVPLFRSRSLSGRPSVSCKEAHPGPSPFLCKDMQSRTVEFAREREGRERNDGTYAGKREGIEELEKILLSFRSFFPGTLLPTRSRVFLSCMRDREIGGWLRGGADGWREGKTRRKKKENGRKGSTDIRRRKGSGGWSDRKSVV